MRELTREVLLIVPTHDHPGLLPLALASAQNQTVGDVDIVVIGDGVGDDTRDAMSPVLRGDSRVQFLDLPKGQRFGEAYRDGVIRQSGATYVTYLGDDDLMFPHHLQTMLDTLLGRMHGEQTSTVEFVSTLPIFITPDWQLYYVAMDLERPGAVAWHLDHREPRNSVSLSGATHTRDSYLRLPRGWRPAPAGRWSDHHMWVEFFSQPGFSGRTAQIATVAKFHSSGRTGVSAAARLRELSEFAVLMKDPDFVSMWNRRVAETIRLCGVRWALERTATNQRMRELQDYAQRLEARVAELEKGL